MKTATRPERASNVRLLPRLHRAGAVVLVLYAAVHLANHLAALGGVDSHIAFMETLRRFTRIPAVEGLLLAAVVVQAFSGLASVVRRPLRQRPPFSRLQALSGAYLAFFLLVHVSSVLAGRFVSQLDTNFYFAAAGLHVAPFQFFFVPYYGLAVVALFVHLGAALRAAGERRLGSAGRLRAGLLGAAIGTAVAALILAAFMGVFHPVEIPAAYVANLRAFMP
jgi:succinate dehydrogenase/fumarate reductase cytochrome b subunit